MNEGDEAAAPPAPYFARPRVNAPKPIEIGNNDGESWKLWKDIWEDYTKITGLVTQEDDYVTSVFLYTIGTDARKIYNGMKFGDGEDGRITADIIKKFDRHFLGQTLEYFERFQFNRRNQESGETIDQYMSDLRNMSKTCGFCDCMKEQLIMDRIIIGISDDKVREKLISTHDLDLNRAVDICRAMEAASLQIKAMRSEEISRVTEHFRKTSMPKCHKKTADINTNRLPRSTVKSKTSRCKFCNQTYLF